MFCHWAIYAPAAFLRTKSGLSWYGAPSMGSETTPPYAWLLWRFKNTLANPVTWCCRCLYDLLRKVTFAKSAQRCTTPERIARAYLLSFMLRLNSLRLNIQSISNQNLPTNAEIVFSRLKKKTISRFKAKKQTTVLCDFLFSIYQSYMCVCFQNCTGKRI